MSQEDVDIVRSIYDAFGRGEVRAMMGLLHPEVEVYQSERLPWGGRYAGAETGLSGPLRRGGRGSACRAWGG